MIFNPNDENYLCGYFFPKVEERKKMKKSILIAIIAVILTLIVIFLTIGNKKGSISSFYESIGIKPSVITKTMSP